MSSSKSHFQPPRPSKFKSCLTNIPVPDMLMEGISVIKLHSNGKSQPAHLTLARDKFTIYVTSYKFKSGKVGKLNSVRRPLLRKVTSIGSNDEDSDERSIDVGSLDRIERGQRTLKFELSRKLSKKNNITSPSRGNNVNSEVDEVSRSFSIIFGGERTIDLIVTEQSVSRDDIVDSLNQLLQTYTVEKTKVGNDVLLLRHIWSDVDRDQSNYINASELSDILNRINYSMKKSDVEKLYHSFGKKIAVDRRKGCTFEQCLTTIHKIKRDSTWQVKPVQQIWFDLFGEFMNNGKMRTRVSADSFLRKFLWQKQGESNLTAQDVEQIFKKLNGLEFTPIATDLLLVGDNVGRYIDKDRFEAYLVSKDNDIFDPIPERFDRSTMTESLSRYWINSSHNTYLTGDQLQSRSSVEMYMNVLYRGCRCIEIDCFDGHYTPDEGTPIPLVYHKMTFTSVILFSDVIHGIKCFLNNNPDCYPIILSLDNHCTIEFQDAMADLLMSVLGENLYIPDDKLLNDMLPSPEELKGKVLIKGKKMSEDLALDAMNSQDMYDTDSDDDSEIGDEHRGDQSQSSPNRVPKPQASSRSDSAVTSITGSSSNSAVSLKLSQITIFQGVRLVSFEENMSMSKDKMISFDESKARKLCKSPEMREQWITYNESHLSRVYPSGKRVDSSNFSPVTGWSTGCQLMAINFQTPDLARRLNDGRFRQNGNVGYVLKPNLKQESDESSRELSLSIRILCGTCLPKPKGSKKGECIDPYVHVSLVDVPSVGGKELVTNHFTHHVSRNGFNPIWVQDAPFQFKVQNPNVAMLTFSVWDKDVAVDDFIGSSSVPISCIREGYRSVRIFDANNKQNGAFECASLLVEVKTKQKGQEIKMW